MKIGSQNILFLRAGSASVSKLYLGAAQIWPTDDVVYLPAYELTRQLIDWGGFKWIPNDNPLPPTPPRYNAKLLNEDGSAYEPTWSDYPMDGTLTLHNGAYADTEYVIPQDSEQVIIGVYDVNPGTSFKMYAVHYKGNGTADIYEADDKTAFALKAENFEWSPPTESWKITEGKPYELPAEAPPVDIKVSFGITPSVTGYTLNVMESWTDTTTVYQLLNTDGSETGITAQLTQETEEFAADGVQSGDDSGFLTDAQFLRGWYPTNKPVHVTINGLAPEKTYKLRTSGSCESTATARRFHFFVDDQEMTSINGNTYIETGGNLNDGFEVTVSGKASVNLEWTTHSSNDHPSIDGLDIVEVV